MSDEFAFGLLVSSPMLTAGPVLIAGFLVAMKSGNGASPSGAAFAGGGCLPAG